MTAHGIYALLAASGVGWIVWQAFRPRRRAAGPGSASHEIGGSEVVWASGGDGQAACGDGGGDGGSCGD